MVQDELFLDREGGAYFNTPGEDPSVLLRVKEDHDGAEPSGNSVSAINLVRLASMVSGSKSDHYRQNGEHLLVCPHFKEINFSSNPIFFPQIATWFWNCVCLQAVFESRLKEMATAVPLMCYAADMLSIPYRKQVVLVGHKPSEEFENMLAAAHASYDPNKTVITQDINNTFNLHYIQNLTLSSFNVTGNSYRSNKHSRDGILGNE